MKIVAVSACPTGLMHTFMAEKALKAIAKDLDAEIKVETQSALGIENKLDLNEIDNADVIILAIDTNILEMERFVEKDVIRVNTTFTLKNKEELKEMINAKELHQ